MAVKTFIDGQSKRVFSHIPYTFVNGQKRRIRKAYTFVNGQKKIIWDFWSFAAEKLFTDPTQTFTETLPAGTYDFIKRGGGGSGGTNGTKTDSSGAGGLGGAGGKGKLTIDRVTITSTTTVNIKVGTGGVGTGATGGYTNGGTGNGGNGGKSGHASYVKVGTSYYGANGGAGGGGGGGGGTNRQARYKGGAGSGAGGEYLRWNQSNGTETTVAGKNGVNGNGYRDPINGTTGNTTDFPSVYSGRGHNGRDWETASVDYWSSYVYGGGASGGAGGGSNWNTDYSTGGAAGGGAGGDDDASGGGGGDGWLPGENGYNYHTTPTNTLAENQSYGVNANYGIGGATNTNGTSGFVLIRRVA